MTSADEALQLLEDCERREARLSSWEHDFVASLRHQLDCGKHLSPSQVDKLEEVWERVSEFPARSV
jgi:hypothetical protein